VDYVFLLGRILYGGFFIAETDPMQKMSQRVHFQKNIALLGAALMLLVIRAPWPLSIATL
jgi:hypothetical protein